jgi:iron complex outermembrane receptor protein
MPVKPETAKNYEMGTKNSLFDRHLYLNATLFWTDYFGFQTSVTSFLPDGTFLTFLNSVGHLRTRGLEMDFLGKVSNRLSFNGSAALMDAKVVDFPFGPCYSGQTLAQGCFLDPRVTTNPGRVQDLGGKRLNNAPKYKFNVGSQYDVPLGGSSDWGAFVTANYRWQSKINFALSQDPVTVQDAYGVFDASIGLAAEDGKYKASLFVNNLFDKRHAVGIGNTTSGFSAAGVTGFGTNWQPARDAFRYLGLRLDANF